MLHNSGTDRNAFPRPNARAWSDTLPMKWERISKMTSVRSASAPWVEWRRVMIFHVPNVNLDCGPLRISFVNVSARTVLLER